MAIDRECAEGWPVKHIVGFSGGIDSQACARWVLNRYPAEDVILTNSDAGGNEHPLTMAFVDEYSANVHPVVKVQAIVADIWETPGWAETRGLDGSAPLDFPTLMDIKRRPPSRKVQFCTTVLKLAPQRRWIAEAFGPAGPYAGQEYVRYSGVRRDESVKRRNAPFQQWDDYYDCWLYAPLVDWPKQWCFDYVKRYGEAINPLYEMGFGRVGCAPCINSNKADIANWASRFPGMIDKVRMWEARTGLTFFMPVDRDGIANGVDDVVEWAQTARGGQHRFLPMMNERSGCESKYGLCE
jgi:3'-phosphoadenosine 5'-phosphosulfate sulfotransferase (PAPS reductase)/FAD synthetase